MRLLCYTLLFVATVIRAQPLPIDPLWESESFLKTITGSYGIDSRIEPQITVDEEHYLGEASKAMAEKDREKAISILTESSILAESPAMLSMAASLQYENGDLEEAIAHFEEALELFPNFRDAHRNLAVALLRKNKIEEAQAHLVRAMELGSREGLTMGLLGYCHAFGNHHRAALDAYRLARLSQPTEREWILGEAQALLALEKDREASDVLQELIDSHPSDKIPWLIQSDAWTGLNKPAKAIANLEIWRRSGSLEPQAILTLGHLYLQNDLPSLALSRYLEAIAAGVPLSGAAEALGYLADRHYWTAAKEISESIETSSDYQNEMATSSLEPDIESSLVRNRALIELEIGDAEKGANLVEGWLEKEPLDGDALILLSRFHQLGNRREEAEMLLEQAERLPDHAAAAFLAHGKLLVENEGYEQAIPLLEKAFRLEPHKSTEQYLEAVREIAR